jgi:phosphatidylglycerol:prolipoprotein diacylglycerol transferase
MSVYWYGVLMASAVLLGFVLAMNTAKKHGWNPDDIADFALLAVPLGIIGARAYYVIFSWEMYADNLSAIFKIWEGGLAIYGSIIGGAIAVAIFCKWKKKSVMEMFDICVPSLALGQAIGRWGNFFNQEAFGFEVTNKAHMWFPLAVRIDATDTIHYATFFYESVWCLLLAILLFAMVRRFKRKGDAFLCYAILYSVERTIVEGFRTDSLYMAHTGAYQLPTEYAFIADANGIRVSQLLSLVLAVVLILFVIVRAIRTKKAGYVVTNAANPYFGMTGAQIAAGEKPVPREETCEGDCQGCSGCAQEEQTPQTETQDVPAEVDPQIQEQPEQEQEEHREE